MLSPWSPLPDDFILEDYLWRYRDALEAQPERYAGRWARACQSFDTPAFREVRLDLGCGKGAFTVGCALREPDVLFLGLDTDPICTAFAARLAMESGARNIVFLPGRDNTLENAFAGGELSTIYLNFPTPWPPARRAPRRLTYGSRLSTYRHLLGPSGHLFLQTDNLALFSYTVAQLGTAGFRVLESTHDAQREFPTLPETGYEHRTTEMGARIHALWATPDAEPTAPEQPLPESLYDYLPANLDELDYVPLEMRRAVTAMRNAQA